MYSAAYALLLYEKSGDEKVIGDVCDFFSEFFDFIPVVMIIHISSGFLNAVDVAEIVSDGLDVIN